MTGRNKFVSIDMQKCIAPTPQPIDWKPIAGIPEPGGEERYVIGGWDGDEFFAEQASWAASIGWIANDGRLLYPTHWLVKLPPPPDRARCEK